MQVWQDLPLSRRSGLGAVILVLFALSYLHPLTVKAEENHQSFAAVSVSSGVAGQVSAASRVSVKDAYGRLPLSFEENRGQAPESVRFISRGHAHTLLLTNRGAVLALQAAKAGAKGLTSDQAVIRMKILGGTSAP